jgi:hypothetical protein
MWGISECEAYVALMLRMYENAANMALMWKKSGVHSLWGLDVEGIRLNNEA